MSDIEQAVRDYLSALTWRGRRPGWLCFDKGGRLLASGGELAAYGIPPETTGDSLTFLTGLLPLGGEPEVIDCIDAGGGRPAELHLVPLVAGDLVILLDAGAEAAGFRGMMQKANELELLRVKQARLISDLDAFAHTVSHDLRNPLAGIIGLSEVLLDEQPSTLSDFQRESLGSIMQTGRKMVRIMEELMLLAGLRSQTVTPRAIDMAAVLHEALKRLHGMIVSAGAVIEQPASWPAALGHAPWVEEVWANYISNAVKYGGVPPRIELSGRGLPDGTVRFEVRDRGPGVPPERRDKLFTRHAESRTSRTTGHGLGLSIVRSIVERQNGTVGCDDAPGGGSVFYFTLPQVPAARAADDISEDGVELR